MNRKIKKLIVIGGPGNGSLILSTVIDINRVSSSWEVIGFLNDFETSILEHPVLGKIDRNDLENYLEDEDVYFIWGLFSLNNREQFARRLESLQIPDHRWATLVHPSAVVSELASVNHGVCIHPLAAIAPNCRIGEHSTVFAQAYIAHDAELGRYSYVANNASIGAHVKMSEGAYAGTGCIVREFLELGEWSLAGMGSVVTRNVDKRMTVVGSPAKEHLVP